MRQKPPGEPDVPALFSALFVAIPMALGYAGLKYAVRSQFMVWDDFSIWELVKESVGVYLASLVFVAVTLQYRKSRLMNVLLGIFATVFGCWMVHATEIDRSYGAVSRTPGGHFRDF